MIIGSRGDISHIHTTHTHGHSQHARTEISRKRANRRTRVNRRWHYLFDDRTSRRRVDWEDVTFCHRAWGNAFRWVKQDPYLPSPSSIFLRLAIPGYGPWLIKLQINPYRWYATHGCWKFVVFFYSLPSPPFASGPRFAIFSTIAVYFNK